MALSLSGTTVSQEKPTCLQHVWKMSLHKDYSSPGACLLRPHYLLPPRIKVALRRSARSREQCPSVIQNSNPD